MAADGFLRYHLDPPGPDSDAALGTHDVRTAAISEFSEGPNLRAQGPDCRALSGCPPEWDRYESAPVTEGAVFYNGAGGRAFAAMWDLRLVGCRAAGRASR